MKAEWKTGEGKRYTCVSVGLKIEHRTAAGLFPLHL